MRGKYQFWLHLVLILSLIISTALVGLVSLVGPVRAQVYPTRVYVDTSLIPPNVAPGGTFTVYVRVEDPVDLMGFEFKLKYKTSVLTTAYNKVTVGNIFGSYPMQFEKDVNDALGYVWLGFTGTSGVSGGVWALAKIIFTVDSYGGSCLSLSDTSKHGELYQSDTSLINSASEPIPHEVEDGHFVNSPVHDIAITSVTPSSTSVIQGQTVDVNVVARNHGNSAESFTVAAYANTTTAIAIPQTVTNLALGSRTPLTFTWDTTGLTPGRYIISANATTVPDEADTNDNTYNMAYDFFEKTYTYVTITVQGYPAAAFKYSPMYPLVNETVTFNASDSTPNGGRINRYEWNFGDGTPTSTSSSPFANHPYTSHGIKTVTLTIKDSEDLTDTTSKPIIIYLPDVVALINVTAHPTQVTKPNTVSIDVTVANNGVSSETFDVTVNYNSTPINTQNGVNLGANTSTTLNFIWYTTYVPATPTGTTYTISANATELPYELNTTNNRFIDDTVTIYKSGPSAKFTYSPNILVIGVPVNFDASLSTPDPKTNASIISYVWNFGDGTGTGVTTTHTYMTPGTYTVTLTVTDNDLLTDSTFQEITVVKPPVAHFTYSPNNPIVSEVVTFNASTSTPNGGTIVSYSWNFDDGNTGTGIITTNTYTTAETYTVTLTITDSEGVTDTESQQVTIKAPVARFTYSPIDPCRGQNATFDASASTPSRGTITSYAWDFESDGTIDASEVIVTHNYTVYGNYLVTLKITDSEGLWDIATDTVHVYPHPPVAKFTFSPYPPKAKPETITFNASESSDPDGYVVNYRWDFGDNSTILEGPDYITYHQFQEKGLYAVNLTVTDNEGLSNSMVQKLAIEIPPPVAYLTYSPMSPVECEEIIFNASKSSSYKGTNIVKYTWDFGDGSTSTGVTTNHTYLNAGSYTVNLTVTIDTFPPLSGSILQSVNIGRGFIEVEADVGTIHFVGERAEFYFLVKFLGKPVNATEPINAKLYYAGTIITNFPTKVEHVDTGLYRILWDPIPNTASSGTYNALIQASYFTLKDSTIESFLISKTLTEWNPLLISIDKNIATIITNVGVIKLNLKDINATLTEIIVNSKKETLAKIDSAVGTITAKLKDINATLTGIIIKSKGEILAKINYYLDTQGTITAKLKDINATLTEIIVDNQGEILAKIDSAIGSVTTTLDAINAKVVAIDGNVATIETDVGTVKTTVSNVLPTATTPLYVTSVFSVVAAIVALIVLFVLRRKPT